MSRPRLFRTETVMPPRARVRANRSTCWSGGRENGIRDVSFSGIRFTLTRSKGTIDAQQGKGTIDAQELHY